MMTHKVAKRDGKIVVRYRDELRSVITGERRALQADSDVAGGYLLAGQLFDELLVQERNTSIMRQISRVVGPIEGDELPIPSQESALSDAVWSTELTGATTDSTTPYGRRTLHPHPISKRVRVSRKLLRVQDQAEDWILQALADAVATPQETAFLQGDGSGEPLGLTVDPDVPVYTTSVSGNVVGDDLRQWVFSLPARFQANARIVTTPAFLGYVLTLKDGSGNYMIKDYNGRFLGKPVLFSDGMPTAISGGSPVAGAVAAVVGDFGAGYWICDSDQVEVLRLEDLYAESNEVGYQLRQGTDGAAVIPTAFYLLKIKS